MEKIDTCVMCGKDTPHMSNENIETRNFYIEGAGQLCYTCHNEIY